MIEKDWCTELISFWLKSTVRKRVTMRKYLNRQKLIFLIIFIFFLARNSKWKWFIFWPELNIFSVFLAEIWVFLYKCTKSVRIVKKGCRDPWTDKSDRFWNWIAGIKKVQFDDSELQLIIESKCNRWNNLTPESDIRYT